MLSWERALRCRVGRGFSGVPLHHGTRSERLEADWRVRYGTFIGAVLGGLRLACKPTYKGSEKSGPFGFQSLTRTLESTAGGNGEAVDHA